MIKGASYKMMINHLSHTITELGSSDKWAQFQVIILDKNKIYHKFNWQVEKYTLNGSLKSAKTCEKELRTKPLPVLSGFNTGQKDGVIEANWEK